MSTFRHFANFLRIPNLRAFAQLSAPIFVLVEFSARILGGKVQDNIYDPEQHQEGD
jgi:hypothetical protein